MEDINSPADSPVEITTRFVTRVATLDQALAFVADRGDLLESDSLQVTIAAVPSPAAAAAPYAGLSSDEVGPAIVFEVALEGRSTEGVL